MTDQSLFYCVACGSHLVSTRHPSGTAWRCKCGACHGWFSDFGALEIGIVPPPNGDSSFTFEEFT
jgi:hypothetical protein